MEIKLTKSDWYIIAIFYLVAIPIAFSGYDYSKGLYEPTTDTIIYCIFTALVSYVVVYKLFPKFFPEKKILTLFFWTCIVLALGGAIEILLYAVAEKRDIWDISVPKLFSNFKNPMLWVEGIASSSENSGILIGILLGKKFFDAQLDIQQREKEKRESELRFLKSQIDPHFLFNNLNTVDALIDSNPEGAKIYVNRLSNLYRYLTRTKDDEVVPLEEELEFVKNYIYLMEQRYGAAYKFQIQNNMDSSDLLIPPGALQTLLENVIKHNNGSEAQPIKTEIIIDSQNISVRNNVSLKKTIKDSYGVGLTNLKARYKLLSDKQVNITDGTHFKVILPNLRSLA